MRVPEAEKRNCQNLSRPTDRPPTRLPPAADAVGRPSTTLPLPSRPLRVLATGHTLIVVDLLDRLEDLVRVRASKDVACDSR